MVGWWSGLIRFFLWDEGVLGLCTGALFLHLSTGVLSLLALHCILFLLMVRSIIPMSSFYLIIAYPYASKLLGYLVVVEPRVAARPCSSSSPSTG